MASRAQGTIVLNFVSDAVFLQNLRRDVGLSRFRVLCCKPFDPTLQHFTETRTSAATFLRMRRTRVAKKRSHLFSTPLSTGILHSPYNRKRKVLRQGLSHLLRQSTSAKHQLTRCTWCQTTTAPQKRHNQQRTCQEMRWEGTRLSTRSPCSATKTSRIVRLNLTVEPRMISQRWQTEVCHTALVQTESSYFLLPLNATRVETVKLSISYLWVLPHRTVIKLCNCTPFR